MINVQQVLAMQAETVARWHQEPIANTYDGFLSVACQQHQFNYELWHEEDIARSPDVSDLEIANVKRAIDKHNQNRNDWIEKLDDWISETIASAGVSPSPEAPLNTETPGSAIDRLSIMSLRLFHLEEQLERPDITEEHRDKVSHRIAVCELQRDDLAQSLVELLSEIAAGTKRHRTYRQFKMYNDPTLNPYLYNRKSARKSA
jgi:hypothetical protein